MAFGFPIPDTVASCATPALPVFQTIDTFLLFDYRGLSSGTRNGQLNHTLSSFPPNMAA
jgi:hypothetical protein